MRRTTILLLLAVLGLASGCGGAEGGGSQKVSGGQGKQISADDAAKVQDAQRTVLGACGDGSVSTQGTQAAGRAALPTAVGEVLQVLHDNGTSDVYETGNVDRAKQLKDVTAALAAQLRTCQAPAQADRLREALSAKG